MVFEKEVYGAEGMESLGASFSMAFRNGGVVYLEGDLGMGKTTMVRGMLRGLGYLGPVKSPTYTIVEPYEMNQLDVFHFDLYRLVDPEELEFIGIRDYFAQNSLCLVEWARMGMGFLPQADIVIAFKLIRQGRNVSIAATTEKGSTIIKYIQ